MPLKGKIDFLVALVLTYVTLYDTTSLGSVPNSSKVAVFWEIC